MSGQFNLEATPVTALARSLNRVLPWTALCAAIAVVAGLTLAH